MRQILLIAVIIVATIGVGAQRKAASHKKTAAKPDARAVLDEIRRSMHIYVPFDKSLTKLTPDFYGNDPDELGPKLARVADVQKRGCDRFEKTAECQGRLNDLYKAELADGIHANDTVAFATKASCTYEPDPEIIKCGPADYGSYPVGGGFPIQSQQIGSVKYVLLSGYSLRPIQKTGWGFGVPGHPPEWAAGHFDDLEYLMVGEFNQPFFDGDREQHGTVTMQYFYLIFDLKEVWLFEKRTGQILRKYKLGE